MNLNAYSIEANKFNYFIKPISNNNTLLTELGLKKYFDIKYSHLDISQNNNQINIQMYFEVYENFNLPIFAINTSLAMFNTTYSNISLTKLNTPFNKHLNNYSNLKTSYYYASLNISLDNLTNKAFYELNNLKIPIEIKFGFNSNVIDAIANDGISKEELSVLLNDIYTNRLNFEWNIKNKTSLVISNKKELKKIAQAYNYTLISYFNKSEPLINKNKQIEYEIKFDLFFNDTNKLTSSIKDLFVLRKKQIVELEIEIKDLTIEALIEHKTIKAKLDETIKLYLDKTKNDYLFSFNNYSLTKTKDEKYEFIKQLGGIYFLSNTKGTITFDLYIRNNQTRLGHKYSIQKSFEFKNVLKDLSFSIGSNENDPSLEITKQLFSSYEIT